MVSLTLSSLILHCHLHPLQAANCCRNSRLVVDEDDLMWVKNLRKLPCIVKTDFAGNFHSKPFGNRKIKSVFSDVK